MIKAAGTLAQKRIGALMAFERSAALDEFIERGRYFRHALPVRRQWQPTPVDQDGGAGAGVKRREDVNAGTPLPDLVVQQDVSVRIECSAHADLREPAFLLDRLFEGHGRRRPVKFLQYRFLRRTPGLPATQREEKQRQQEQHDRCQLVGSE